MAYEGDLLSLTGRCLSPYCRHRFSLEKCVFLYSTSVSFTTGLNRIVALEVEGKKAYPFGLSGMWVKGGFRDRTGEDVKKNSH